MRWCFVVGWIGLVSCGTENGDLAPSPRDDAGATTRPDASASSDAADGASSPEDAATPPTAPTEIDVFLIGGQSNAVGIAARGDSPHVAADTALSYYEGQLVPANDPVGNAQVVSAWPAFANAYVARTGHRIGLVPSAVAGSALLAANDDGHGNWSETGTAFGAAVANAQAGLAAFRAAGYRPRFEGVLWAQGEADAGRLNAGQGSEAAYRMALRALIGRFAEAVGPGFYLLQTATNAASSDMGFAAVRRAQDAAVSPLGSSWVVARNALALVQAGGVAEDGVHYTQDTLNQLGTVAGDNVGSIVRGGPNRADQTTDTLAAVSCAGHEVSFQAFVNASGACAASTFAVSLGDQNAAEIVKPEGTCSSFPASPVHAYAADGDFAVQLFRGSIAEAQAGDRTLLAETQLHLGAVGSSLPLDVFVVAGQSNSVGNSKAAWRAPKTVPGTAYQFLVGSDDPSDTGAGPGCVLGGDEVLGILSFGSAWPEFANTYVQRTGHRIAFVATGKNGSSLLEAGWDPEGPLFERAAKRVQHALTSFGAAGFVPQLQGVLWVQGEADTGNTAPTLQDDYAAGLRDLVQRFRSRFGAQLPFYVFQTGAQSDADPVQAAAIEARYAAVRAAQDSVESPADHVFVVSRQAKTFLPRGMMTDFVHYDQAGYNELGRTGAEAVVAALGLGIAAPDEATLTATVNGARVTLRGFVNAASSCDERSYSVRWADGASSDLTVPGGACAPRAFTLEHAFAAGQPVTLWEGHAADVAAGLGQLVAEVVP